MNRRTFTLAPCVGIESTDDTGGGGGKPGLGPTEGPILMVLVFVRGQGDFVDLLGVRAWVSTTGLWTALAPLGRLAEGQGSAGGRPSNDHCGRSTFPATPSGGTKGIRTPIAPRPRSLFLHQGVAAAARPARGGSRRRRGGGLAGGLIVAAFRERTTNKRQALGAGLGLDTRLGLLWQRVNRSLDRCGLCLWDKTTGLRGLLGLLGQDSLLPRGGDTRNANHPALARLRRWDKIHNVTQPILAQSTRGPETVSMRLDWVTTTCPSATSGTRLP